MLKILCKFLLIPLCFVLLSSCSKEEGLGGRASIKGKLFAANVYDPYMSLIAEDGARDEKVYLIYGDSKSVPNDDVRCGFDGSFEFPYLRKGKYRLFVYSLDTANGGSITTKPIIKEIELSNNEQVVNVNDFIVYKNANDKGTSSINGKLLARDYNSDFTVIKGEFYLPDEYVYIIYGSGNNYHARTKTNEDGSFTFSNLRKGNYTVYAFSKDSTQSAGSGIVSIKKKINISENHRVEQLSDLIIIK